MNMENSFGGNVNQENKKAEQGQLKVTPISEYLEMIKEANRSFNKLTDMRECIR